MSMVIENVRQLRGTVDDYCPKAAEGVHTYDYGPGRCRQVKGAEITMKLGWAVPPTGSALIPRRCILGGGIAHSRARAVPRHGAPRARQRHRGDGVLRPRARPP